MIAIEPYATVAGVNFGSSEAEVIAVFGEPDDRLINRVQEIELRYKLFTVRFDNPLQCFREFTLLPGCPASINGLEIEWTPSFLGKIQDLDSDLMEVAGFVVSLKLGVSFSGFHDDDDSQRAIHVFRKGGWDRFKARMKPFCYTP